MQATTNCLGNRVVVTSQFIKTIHPKFPLILKISQVKEGKSDIF